MHAVAAGACEQPRRRAEVADRGGDVAEHRPHALGIGPAASAAACARRSLEAATICMALVIFCVALVAAMRTRISFRLGILAYRLLR